MQTPGAGDDPDDALASEQASLPAAKPGDAPATPASPGKADAAPGSPAQPLLQAAAGAGATLVKAQSLPPHTPHAITGPASRSKPGAGGTASAKPADPPTSETAAAPDLVASPAPATGDDGDDASGQDGRADAHAPSGPDAGQTDPALAGFTPTAASTAPSPPQAGTQATPLSTSAADLAAQMAARLAGGSSHFKLQLNPLGLGQVDVTVSIGANRQLTAALAFADPQTASALSAHAGDLRTVLEQAGFSVPTNGFDFTANGALATNVQPGGFGAGGGLGGDGSGRSAGGERGAPTRFGGIEAQDRSPGSDAAAWAGGGDSRLDIRI